MQKFIPEVILAWSSNEIADSKGSPPALFVSLDPQVAGLLCYLLFAICYSIRA
jgi:hypothetical protein